MGAARVLATVAAGAAVVGCIVVGARLATGADSADAPAALGSPASSAPAVTYPPVTYPAAPSPYALSTPTPTATSPIPAAVPTRTTTSRLPKATPTTGRPRAAATTRAATTRAAAPSTPTKTKAVTKPAATATATKAKAEPKRGIALPLGYRTGDATRVITVTATSRSGTVAHLQAWYKAPGGGWLHYGKGMTAHIGAAGMTPTPSEGMSATPMGSFTLTQAFGRRADPGTSLPYFKTRPSDWWISQAGRLYNTHQRCASACGFNQGAPNEHLYYETPYYNYAVVIDYNTRNAPGGVRPGAGSAFFLHVYPPGTGPTAGCVSIPQDKLVTLMRWLRPATHPRILIGVPR